MVENQMVPDFGAQDVPGPTSEPVVKDVKTSEVVVPLAAAPTPVPAGSKTDPALLLKSLKEERERRQALEAQLQTLQNQPSYIPDDQLSDEGRALKAQIDQLQSIISAKEVQAQQDALYAQHPQLKDKAEDFEAYRAARPGYALEDTAKLFLAEQGLLTPSRKGLEKGGTQRGTPSTGEMTPEDTERIRTTQPRLYLQMIQSGKINPDAIKY